MHRKLSGIFIYPVKSLGGISLSCARAGVRGLEHDRRWMLVDDNNEFVTQRKFAKMALFALQICEDGFLVCYGNEEIRLPFAIEGERTKVKVWDDMCDAVAGKQEWNDWFSGHLEMPVRLVYMPDDSNRAVEEKYAEHEETVSFADGFPVLIIGRPSLDDLNAKLEEPVPMDRFRPNLVFEGGRPFEEDSYSYFTIGGVRFKGVKPCARCIVTTIDQQTGEKGKEPLATLSTYRKDGNKILFGQNVLCLEEGEIAVGDVLTSVQP